MLEGELQRIKPCMHVVQLLTSFVRNKPLLCYSKGFIFWSFLLKWKDSITRHEKYLFPFFDLQSQDFSNTEFWLVSNLSAIRNLAEPLILKNRFLLIWRRGGKDMGFWYFLILLAGLVLLFIGIFKKKHSSSLRKLTLVVTGLICISFALFMFSPGSAEVIADIFNLN